MRRPPNVSWITVTWLLAGPLLLAGLLGSVALGDEGLVRATASEEATLTLFAQRDTRVDETRPTTNFGSDLTLIVGRQDAQVGGGNAQILLWFDVSALPANAQVQRARVELNQIRSTNRSTYRAWAEGPFQPWGESTVSWSTKPAAINLGDSPATWDSASGWKSIFVSNIVKRWVSGGEL
ncbi:MAG: DNRLRE domain-containing protein [Chloroflexi bacterium]|nr:DNRLRE domain-containing protein [Chloroflexota bacterium]